MPTPREAGSPGRSARGRLIVVLPAYNEAEALGPLLERLESALREDAPDYEVLVVDDGSTDATGRVLDEYARRLPIRVERHERNLGLGVAVRDGLRRAVAMTTDADVVVVMDADNTHGPGLIRAMVEAIENGADVVIASRFRTGSDVQGVPIHRRLLSVGASALLRAVFPIGGVRDYTCGYRAYRAAVIRRAFLRYGDDFVDQRGFQSVVDILLKLRALNLVFREVPIVLRYDLKPGASKMKVVRTIVGSLALIARRRIGGWAGP